MHPNDGNQSALKHGAASAERSLASGEELRGLALEAARTVQDELQDVGAIGMLRRDAIRFEAVASMLYARILACTDAEQLDSIIRRWGWIQGHSLRAWQAVIQQEREKDRGLSAADVLSLIEKVADEQDNE